MPSIKNTRIEAKKQAVYPAISPQIKTCELFVVTNRHAPPLPSQGARDMLGSNPNGEIVYICLVGGLPKEDQ